jgi:hypothetical protein
MNHNKAHKMRFEGGFSSGVLPREVASFIIERAEKKV